MNLTVVPLRSTDAGYTERYPTFNCYDLYYLGIKASDLNHRDDEYFKMYQIGWIPSRSLHISVANR